MSLNHKKQLLSLDLLAGDLRYLIDNDDFENSAYDIKLAFGTDQNGKPYHYNLTKNPHIFIGGKAKTGKTNFLNSIIASLVYQFDKDDCKLLMICGIKNDCYKYLNVWNDLPHLIVPVLYQSDLGVRSLELIMQEIDNRYYKLMEKGVDNITEYNKSAPHDKMPYFIVIVDEFINMYHTSRRKTQRYIKRICQVGRAVGVHLILTTEYIIAAEYILNHFSTTIAFKTKRIIDSAFLIGDKGAKNLEETGELLLSVFGQPTIKLIDLYNRKTLDALSVQDDTIVKLRSTFISTDEIRRIVNSFSNS